MTRASRPGESAARDAFRKLREKAEADKDDDGFGAGEGGGAASAPSKAKKGKVAVREARRAGRLRRGEQADLKGVIRMKKKAIQAALRTVGAKTFYRSGKMWVDSACGKRGEGWTKVAYMSDAYFALLKEKPELGKYLALGKVIVRIGSTVYEIG